MKSFIVVLVLLASQVFASFEKQISFYVHGGAVESYKDDQIVLNPDHTVTLKTISPSFADYPNIIGNFKVTLGKDESLRVRNAILKISKNIMIEKYQPINGSSIEELYIGKNKIFWSSKEKSKLVKEIRRHFLDLARKAYKNPVEAISLQCSQDSEQVSCIYENVGSQAVTTVDPLGVSYSISCLDIRGKKENLYKLKEYNPKKMKPKKIKILPSEQYKFSIKTKLTCDYRIVVKTTNMMVNKNYQNVLLGELVSNQLKNK